MGAKGTGRRTWRELYPADEWQPVENFVALDIKYVLFRQRGVRSINPPAAVLSFDGSQGVLDWVVVATGRFSEVEKQFLHMKSRLGGQDEKDSSAELLAHPDYARF
jgi:hypothetical protein